MSITQLHMSEVCAFTTAQQATETHCCVLLQQPYGMMGGFA